MNRDSDAMDEWLDLDELIEKTEEQIELGLHEDAHALLDQYIDFYTEAWELEALYGRLFADLDKPREAITHLRRGLNLDKNNPECLLGIFYAYSMMHEIGRGGKYLLRAEKHHPDNEMVLTALIWYHTESGNLADAIACFDKMQKNGAVNADAFRNVAIAYQRSGLYENAEHCFKIALEINPTYEEVRDLLADLYLYINQEKSAIDLYSRALEKSPKNIRLISRLVYCHTQTGEFDKAVSLAKESIRNYPNSPIGYIDLSYVYLNSSKPELAVEYADKAHDISPFDAEAYRIKGLAWSDAGDWEKGRSSFVKALELDPENTDIMRDFYQLLRNEGDSRTMEEIIHKVIKIEYPYCVEDYWFLADYYRESGQDLKAFHYLNKAYKTVPGEKELIPPIVDIMLERGHTSRSIPFLTNYVLQSGWNETMNDFSRHQQFKNKWAQEGLRFLRYQGQRPHDFRTYLFRRSIERYLIFFLSLICALVACIVAFSHGYLPALILCGAFGGACAAYFIIRHFSEKKAALAITGQDAPVKEPSP